ncbi:polyprenyl diphosphate synthase [Aliidiomarina haloalkalitolerans]|uniref:Ditrans,polycis-undecaprenyl-diphosphate synthase ((2E,6E)-farnesyl-diphosphate specific) n=1 Tax=Aliidiomarina haloalkalitolerans TaxID=859059 RepID=A0A432VXW9_9GAMM|nr:polyprenyl diphosphate synthase [Aliidiomarina haloalkalitolerans]RUO21524.1 di-trans,poly-cis-decaprenylcistransferase [Aliidiomarina haloalkalitolerans]
MTGNSSVMQAVKLPRHVAIIMDGNGRWATQRGKRRTYGHRAGAEAVRRAITFARRNGIEALTLFAFSSENWGRPATEVSVLMELFMGVLKREVNELAANDIRLRVVGDKAAFSARLQKQIQQAEAKTAHCQTLTLNIAANYGGRWDITNAAKAMLNAVQQGTLAPDEITEDTLGQFIQLADGPAPDLLIRTGGDLRISNFLLWQLAYAELYFTEVLWPDFDDVTFVDAVNSFVIRERRFGLTSEQLQQLAGSGDLQED